MTDTPEPDCAALHPLLAASSVHADAQLREAVFAQTARVLWRRRLIRRLAHAAALAACFGAGLLTAEWRHPPAPPRERVVTELPPSRVPSAPEPSALERQASQNPERRDLYRRAGDLYATEEGDLKSALRCYGESLGASTPADLAISSEDHWLLMAIKDARQKEKNDARTNH